jgi:protoporphyrinogen oxidase
MYEIYFKPYTRKVWGKPPAELDALCAKERVAVQNLLDVLAAAFSYRIARFRSHYHLPHSPYQKIFYYPKYGVGQLSDRMIDFIQSKGGRIRLNNLVSSIVKDGNGYKVLTKDGSVYKGDFVVSTIPITQLKDMLGESNHREKPQETLEFRSITFLFLAIKKEFISDNHWIYFPDKNCLFQRASEPKNFSPYLVPQGHSSVCVEIPCDYLDDVWNMGPQELYEIVIANMEQERYLKRADVQDFWVAREQFAYPTNTLYFSPKLKAIKDYIDDFPNLYSIGRQGKFSYVNIDDVMLMGFETAEQIVNNFNCSPRKD